MRAWTWGGSLSWLLVACGTGTAPEVAHPVRVAPEESGVASASAEPGPRVLREPAASGACIAPEVSARLHACARGKARLSGASATSGRHKVGAVFTAAPPPPPTSVPPPSPGADPCAQQSQVTRTVIAQKSGNKDSVMAALDAQLDAYRKFEGSSRDPARIERCANDSAELLIETAIAWHLEAVGTGAVRGTGDPETMARAITLYERVLARFQPDAFARFQFPRLLKGDWPTLAKIAYARADLLYFAKDWARCGPAFDAVVKDDPTGPFTAEAAYASVLCYQNVYLTSRRKADAHGQPVRDERSLRPEDFEPQTLTQEHQAMIRALDRYLCALEPEPNDKQANEAYAEVEFTRARSYFETRHWEEAALGMRDVALHRAEVEVGVYAASLYLEALNVLATRVARTRPSCHEAMRADVPQLVELYCRGAGARDNAQSCEVFARVLPDLAAPRPSE